ncbi:BTB/POZ domain-containing protein KCTD9-like [Chironomus tepperi]|uniref:BTB/POZ domain-containing protein KCTD9-like n=1 Tax=Chironomus tepperi TaxID=113505 RepID=UPI00391EEBA7
MSSEWIKLNVGGIVYQTTRMTLMKDENSMIHRMFSQNDFMEPGRMEDGCYLIDRNGRYFEPILNYLRTGQLIYDKNLNPEGILEEARFFGLENLIQQLTPIVARNSGYLNIEDNTPLTRQDVIHALVQTSFKTELRFQGVNLYGADLRRLDLRNINFKYANLSHCNLSFSNLSYCNLERADLSHANMDSAQLLGIKGLCANLESAVLANCNFEDPSGLRSNLEGCNLKNASLENSNAAYVNLRVANLKGANLKNCILRASVLAGADLERANLSGSDLQEANLRGANLRDAELELMLNPLHMAQAIR